MRTQSDGLLLSTKTWVNMDKVEHFLGFVFKSGLLQNVAYGTPNIKFYSGLKLNVANALLTTKSIHDVTLYLKGCTNYEPLATNTFFCILRTVKPSQPKSLGVLICVGFSTVTNFAKPLVDILRVKV